MHFWYHLKSGQPVEVKVILSFNVYSTNSELPLFLQPRVLDKDQLKTLMGKISNLTGSIRTMENMIENNASEILNEV